MKDALDTAKDCARAAIRAGKRADHDGAPAESLWLTRAATFAALSIAESLRELIEWSALGTHPDDPGFAGPLVTCDDSHPAGFTCRLPVGHDGDHFDVLHGQGAQWHRSSAVSVANDPAEAEADAEQAADAGALDCAAEVDGRPCVLVYLHGGPCMAYAEAAE